jgi:hypothetical protein
MDGYLRLGFGERPHYLRDGLDRVHALLSTLPLAHADPAHHSVGSNG